MTSPVRDDAGETTLLRAARVAADLKQSQVIHALEREAAAERMPIASRASLKTMLSRWENGARVDQLYQRLLCRVYQALPEDLGFKDEPRPQALRPLRIAPTMSVETVSYFRNVLAEHVRADNLMGPHHLVEVVRAQAILLDQVLAEARGALRADLLYLACRYNEFAGWLYQDAGDASHAMQLSDRAMDYGLEINVPRESAYILMRKSNIANDLGRPDHALAIAKAALRHSTRIPPRIRALAYGQLARAHALLGETDQCSRALDSALREVSRRDANSDDLAAYCNSSYISMEAASCWTRLGKPDQAVPIFERSLEAWPQHLRRDQGLCLSRLAIAHAARDNIDQAVTAGRHAIAVVQAATSGRALDELDRLRTRLAPWRRRAEVSELTTQIRDLIRPAA